MSKLFSRLLYLPAFVAGITLCIALLAGCDRAVPPVPAVAEEPGIVGAIDGKRALSFLYGPLDDKLEAAVWVVKGVSDGSPASAALEDGDEALVSIVLARAVKEGDDERFYLGVAMVPSRDEDEEAFDCETCAPVAGATVFVKRGERWVVEAHDPFIATMGFQGHGGDMELVAIGPIRHGILAKSDWQNRGNTGSYAELWTVEGGKIATRFGAQTAAENGGNCSDGAKDGSGLEPCHSYALAIAFEPGPLPEHHDIHLRPSDPMWEYGSRGDKGEKLLRFDGQRYVAATVASSAAAAPTAVPATAPAGATINPAPWTGEVPGNDPVALVSAFIRADAWGLQTGGHWPLVTQFATWTDGPGWDTSAVVETAEIVDHRDSGANPGSKAEVTVRMRKLGNLGTDGAGMPTFDASTAAVVTRRFVLTDVRAPGAKDAHWKIVEPQDGPHESVDHALKVLLPRWCGKRDCAGTEAYRVLTARQAACAPSPIPINRSCGALTR